MGSLSYEEVCSKLLYLRPSFSHYYFRMKKDPPMKYVVIKEGGPSSFWYYSAKKVVGPDFQVPFDYSFSFALWFQNEEGGTPIPLYKEKNAHVWWTQEEKRGPSSFWNYSAKKGGWSILPVPFDYSFSFALWFQNEEGHPPPFLYST